MAVVKSRGWYWKVHGDEYQRFAVADLPKFCGWDVLLRLVKECENTPYYQNSRLIKLSEAEKEALRRKLIARDKALIATAFETGGRIQEVLLLRKENFEVLDDRLVVRDMLVVKRWEKLGEKIEVWQGEGPPKDTKLWHWSHKYEAWVRRKFITKPKMDRRNVLEIPRFEPLTPYIVEWLEQLPDGSWMFPGYGKNVNKPITTTRAYQIVRNVGLRCGVSDICCHWFRSMRASQLAEEYGWREYELMRFFSWVTDKEARRYAKLSSAKLFELMRPEKIRVEVKSLGEG